MTVQRVLIAAAAAWILGACGATEPTSVSANEERGRGEAQLASGSCEGVCGGQAQGGCWCDDLCAQYGDCCEDKEAACEAGSDTGSTCAGACGGQAADGNCWCDESCAEYGDCCDDKAEVCDGDTACPEIMCTLYCPNGFKQDENGCNICACEDDPVCPGGDAICDSICAGDPMDVPDGCPTPMCECEDQCDPVMCEMYCPGGFETDANGCDICECAPLPSCGGFAGLECPDGLICVDDPSDSCDPDNGGADCMGQCQTQEQACPNPNDDSVHYIADSYDDPTVCWSLSFQCEDDQEPFTGQCGCGCIDQETSTPAANSCEGACGGQSASGDCYCDSLCAQYGDCCDDVDTWCADRELASGVCVGNSLDACTTDADCVSGGCGGELCHNPDVSDGISTCVCSAPTEVSGCGCVDGQCGWY